MNLPFFIARRYFLSKRKKNFINIISILSMGGVAEFFLYQSAEFLLSHGPTHKVKIRKSRGVFSFPESGEGNDYF